MKRVLSLLGATLMLATSMVGCGSNGKQTQNDSSKVENKTQAENKSEDQITTVRWWGNYGGQKEFIEGMVQEFNNTVGKEKKIFLEFKNYGGDYEEVINVAASTGKGPELHKINNMMAKHALNSWIVPLNEVPGGEEIIAQYDPQELKSSSFTVDGKTYGVPMHYMTYKLVYNKELFKQAGIVDEKGEAKAPKTWQDVYEYAKKITENGKGKIFGVGMPLKWAGFGQNALTAIGFPATGNWRGFDYSEGKYNFSAYSPILKIVKDIYADGYAFPGAEGLNNDSVRAHFAEGNIGMVFSASWDVGVFNTQFIPKQDWGVAELLSLEGEKEYKQGIKSEALLVVGTPAKDKLEETMVVYNFLVSNDFLVPAYEEGMWIPSQERIAMATKEPSKKGFEAFANMENGMPLIEDPIGQISIEGNSYNDVFIKIILGIEDADKALSDLDNRYNVALDKAVEKGLDRELFKIKDFDKLSARE